MLHLSMIIGEYLTIGKDTVLRLDDVSGVRAFVTVNAPKEITILRGEVLERDGGKRPAWIPERTRHRASQLPWDNAKKKALLEIRETLEQMGDSPETRLLRKKLDCIFPPKREVKPMQK